MNNEQYQKLEHHMKVLGFNIADVPYAPIQREWERYPIIQALRKAEVSTGVEYTKICGGLRTGEVK